MCVFRKEETGAPTGPTGFSPTSILINLFSLTTTPTNKQSYTQKDAHARPLSLSPTPLYHHPMKFQVTKKRSMAATA